jgi:WD40 repeat protein
MVSAGGSEFTPARNDGQTTGQVKLWDAVARLELGELVGHTSTVFSAAFTAGGKTLATGGADQTVRLWDTATRKEQAVLKGHAEAVWSVAFSPDGQTLASAGADRIVILWDVATGRRLGTLQGHDEEVRAGVGPTAKPWPRARRRTSACGIWIPCSSGPFSKGTREVAVGRSRDGTLLASGSAMKP